MRECNNNKIHISSNFLLSICLIIMLDTLLLVPSLHCNTSLHFTKLHLSTLHFLSFTLHYPLIWLNPFTFLIVLFPLTSLNQTQYGYNIPKLISKIMNPFTALKNLSPFHFTFFFGAKPIHVKETLTFPKFFLHKNNFYNLTYPFLLLCCILRLQSVEDRCKDGYYEFVSPFRINIIITGPPSLRRVEHSLRTNCLGLGMRVTE